MQGRRNPSPRINRSFQYADDDEILKISFVVTFAGLVLTTWALALVCGLTPAGRRVLMFFIALNRSLKVGYRGTRATQGALAHAVARATSAGCSVSTLKRGINDLIQNGLLVATWWNLYDRKGELVHYERSAGEWETSKIRIYSLTPFALSLWSKGKRKKVAEIPAVASVGKTDPCVPCPTQLKKNYHDNRLSQPLVGKPLIRDDGSITVSPTVDHVELSPSDNESTPPPRPDLVTAAVTVGHEPSSKARTALMAVPGFKTGCSVPPPVRLPRGYVRTAGNVRLQLLANLYQFLRHFPTRQADCLFAIAREETRPGASRRGLPLCVDWGRWISCWLNLSRGERWKIWRLEILPGLRSSAFAAPPDIERAEKLSRKMQGVAGELRDRVERGRAARAARSSTVEGRLFGMSAEDKKISKNEKGLRLADYLEQFKTTIDPVQRALLKSAIAALLRSI